MRQVFEELLRDVVGGITGNTRVYMDNCRGFDCGKGCHVTVTDDGSKTKGKYGESESDDGDSDLGQSKMVYV